MIHHFLYSIGSKILFMQILSHTVSVYTSWEAIQGTERIQFCLMNHNYDISLTKSCNHFGLVNHDTHVRWSNGLLSPPIEYFHAMNVYDSTSKGGDMECHGVLYLYYIIANTLQECGEFTRVNEEI
jgi:hypothetical protein